MTDDFPVYSRTRVATGPLLFVSGQSPVSADGTVPVDVAAQTRAVMGNVSSCLDDHALGWADVVKLTYFLCDIGDLEAVRGVLREVLPQPRPAASLVEVSALVRPDCRIEIEAIAQLPPHE